MTQIQNVLRENTSLEFLRKENDWLPVRFRAAFRKSYYGKRGPLGRFAVVKAWIYFDLTKRVKEAVL